MEHPKIRMLGVRADRGVAPRAREGEDFPRGIKGLDVTWFERRVVNLERIIACDTDEKLRALREEAYQCRELMRMQATAEGGG